MLIEQINKDEIKITTENSLDKTFLENIKKLLDRQESQIKSLKRENRKLREELSYLNKNKK